MNGELEIFEATPDHAFGCCASALLYVWRGPVTTRAASEIMRMGRAVRARSGNDTGVMLGVVEDGAPPPEPAARKALAEVLTSGAGFIQVSALVCEGKGFHASMTRAVATGVTMVVRPPFPHQVFAEVGAASDWLQRRAQQLGVTSYAATILAERMAALRSAPLR